MSEIDCPSRVALVSGGARGIGAGICRRLAADGLTVVIHCHQAMEEAERLRDEIEKTGGQALVMKADVRDEAAVRGLFTDLDKRLGRLDVVVANAGLAADTRVATFEIEDYRHVFDTNVLGVLLLMREATARLPRGGRIITISSGLAHRVAAGTGLYSASKAAVEALTISLAKELGAEGVTVNCVRPGATSPGMFDRRPNEDRRDFARKTPLGRLGTPEDIAAAVSWLAGPDSGWVTGTCVPVDGGLFV